MSIEADIGYVHLIGGLRQTEIPPAFASRLAPRRAARGRDRDLLMLGLYLEGAAKPDLLELAAKAYFGTPGSVTAAARSAIQAVSAKLLEMNRSRRAGDSVSGGMCCAVLRGGDLYVAQSGPGQAIVLHANAVEQFPNALLANEARAPIGLGPASNILYFHATLAPADYLLMASAIPEGWTPASMSALRAAGLESAIARLTHLAGRQAGAAALVARFSAPPAEAAAAEARPAITAPPVRSPASVESNPAAPQADTSSLAGIIARVRASPIMGDDTSDAEAEEVEAPADAHRAAANGEARLNAVRIGDHVYEFEEGEEVEAYQVVGSPTAPTAGGRLRAALGRAIKKWFAGLPLRAADERLRQAAASVRSSASAAGGGVLRRILPEGVMQPDAQLQIPSSALMAAAIVLPAVVGLLAAVVYVQRGRNQQFVEYLDAARLEAGLARTAPNPLAARPHWEAALDWIGQADAIFPGQPEAAALRAEGQRAVDALEGIQRLALEPLVPGGFGPTAEIKAIVVHGSEVYALDSAHQTVYRATLTEADKFTIDRSFQCSGGAVGQFVVNKIVDITWLDTPNVVGQPALLALGGDGVLMYCKPDGTPPEASQLIAPDPGWKSPKAVEIYTGRLYVFDPAANEIWYYDRPGGVFSERPKSYFVGYTPNLSAAADFAIAQGEVYILRADGPVTFCSRNAATLQTSCAENALFTDSRPGYSSGDRLDDVQSAAVIVYDPPPEPSLYLLDPAQTSVYQLSLKLVLQRQFRPAESLARPVTALAIGSKKEIFLASDNNVYWAKR